jgi:hypothetical protein
MLYQHSMPPSLLCGSLQTKIEELKTEIDLQKNELSSYRQMALKIDEGISKMEETICHQSCDTSIFSDNTNIKKLKDILTKTHIFKIKKFLNGVNELEQRNIMPFNNVSNEIDILVNQEIELSFTHTQQLRQAFEQKKKQTATHKL